MQLCPFLINGRNPHKLNFKIFKETRSVLYSGFRLLFLKKKGNMKALNWDLNLSALKHLKNLPYGANLLYSTFVRNLFQVFQRFFLTKRSVCTPVCKYLSK